MTRSARAAVQDTAQSLAVSSETPALDAELLMAHALGISRSDYLLKGADLIEPEGFAGLVERRIAHEPIAYILGHQPFWSIDLKVAPGMLIPRGDSETLIEAAVRYFAGKSLPAHILDLGTGPGTLLLAALTEFPNAQGLGIDGSETALRYAQGNAHDLGLQKRARFRQGDWAIGLDGQFDLILCNPPYIEDAEQLAPTVADYEPHEALFAGADGLDDYRKIMPDLGRLLASDGIAILEIGWNQATSVGQLAQQEGFMITLYHDLGGRDRALLLQKCQ